MSSPSHLVLFNVNMARHCFGTGGRAVGVCGKGGTLACEDGYVGGEVDGESGARSGYGGDGRGGRGDGHSCDEKDGCSGSKVEDGHEKTGGDDDFDSIKGGVTGGEMRNAE
eukprot:6186301-Pleurochrysis_carterae.AAC.1